MFVLKCGTKKSKAVGEREGSGAVNLKWVFIGVYFSFRLAVGNCKFLALFCLSVGALKTTNYGAVKNNIQ